MLQANILVNAKWSDEIGSTFIDNIFSSLQKNEAIKMDDAQELYGHYFELAKNVLERPTPQELEQLKKSLNSIKSLIDSLNKGDGVIEKLKSNFGDLIDAVELKNKDYFGITKEEISTTTDGIKS